MPFSTEGNNGDVQPSAAHFPRAAMVVLLVGLLLTAVITVQYEHIEREGSVQHFNDRVDRAQAAIESRLGTYITVLNSAAGLFDASEEVTPEEFGRFIRRLELETFYAGLDSVGFVQRVQTDEIDALVDRLRRAGRDDFVAMPAPDQPEHFIITHFEPFDFFNAAALGLDLSTRPRRMQAMQRAMETGLPAATDPINLLAELDPDEQLGFVMYVPVYDDGEVHGFVFSSFSAQTLMSIVLSEFPEMAFRLYIGREPAPERLLFERSAESGPGEQLKTSREINVAGRTWAVVFHGPMQEDMWIPVLPIVGMLVSGVFSAIVWNLTRARGVASARADELRQQREWFAVTLGSIGDAVLATDHKGRVTFMNTRAQELTGWTIDEARGRNAGAVLQFVDEESGTPIESPIRDALQTQSNTELPSKTLLVRRDGTALPVDDIGAPIRTSGDGSRSPRVIGAVVTFRDITPRRRAQEALRESQARLQFALDSAQVGEWDFDVVTGESRRSLRHDQAFGYEQPVDEWSFDLFLQHVHPDDREAVADRFRRSLDEGTDWDDVFRVIWPDGTVHWLETHGSVYEYSNGRATRMLGLVEDITERKGTEEQLRRSEERFRNLVMATSSIIWTANGDGSIVHEVGSWEEYTGQTPQEYKGDGWLQALHPEDRQDVANAWAEANASGTPIHLRYRLRRHDDEYRRVDVRGVPILDEHGNIREWVGSITDVEDQQRVAEALLVSEQKFRWIIESAVDFAIFTFDIDGRIDSWNPGAERVLGYKENEIIGKDVRIIFTEADQASGQPELERQEAAAELSALDERWHVRADGEHFFAAGRVMPLKDDDGQIQGFVKILHDRTNERRAHEELERRAQQLLESEARFRTMADSAPVYIWMSDADKSCTWFNKPWLEFTGRTLQQELGLGWFDGVHPEDKEQCLQTFSNSFDKRQPFKMKYRLRRRDGEFRWLLDHGIPLFESDDDFAGFIGSCIDITELEEARETLERYSVDLERLVNERTAKLKESHEQLRLAERMASLGTLAAGIGHDLGNLLLPLRMRLDVLEPHVPEAERENVHVIRSAAEYLGNLAKGLRHLSTNPERANGWVQTNLGDWWRESEPLLRNALPKHVNLKQTFDADLSPVRIAPAALTQAVFNLIQNSGNALADADQGTVHVWARSSQGHPGNPDRPVVRIGVSDDGPGMSDEIKRRCLEPFFTTKTREFSTGLGLSLVQSVIKRAGGYVEIESESGQGTTFVLVVPAGIEEKARVGDEQMPNAVVSMDDPRMQAFVVAELKSLGFAVQVRRTGSGEFESVPESDASVWVFKAAEPEIHMNVLRRFAEQDSKRRVVVFGEQQIEEGAVADQFVQSPANFRPSTIREALRRAASACGEPASRIHVERERH